MPKDDSPQTMLDKLSQLEKDSPGTLSGYAAKFVEDCRQAANDRTFLGYTLGQVTYLERLYFTYFQ